MRIALIGCGKMGSALLRGWISSNVTKDIQVLEPGTLPAEFTGKVMHHKDSSHLKPADVFFLAVKPQVMSEVCTSIKHAVNADTLIVSIAAGQTISSFKNYFSAQQPVIRTMPNTPAAIGKGISVAVANENAHTRKNDAQLLLSALGSLEWIEDESLMDAVTALSGSGPAYVFLLIETLAKAGEKCGLSSDISMKLARQTVIGSAALAEADPKSSAIILRQNVTSPGGTTEAALKVLMAEKSMQDIFDRALAAATQRGKELSKE